VDGILGHSLLLSRVFLVGIPSWVGFEATTCCCLRPFSVGIPSWMGFSRPQLVVVSGLFRWESLRGWDFLGHNLLLSQASFFTMEFRLSRSLSHELSFFLHNGILAITKPFSRTLFLFSQWNSGYHEAFLTNFLFSRWNSGYHEAFLTNFLFSRWNSGYHEAFLTNFLFSRWNSGYHEAFLTNFLFSRWNSGYHEAFLTNFLFSQWNS
jgi:hypothetical protein